MSVIRSLRSHLAVAIAGVGLALIAIAYRVGNGGVDHR